MEINYSKQRIIGIVVLLGLLALIVPFLLKTPATSSEITELEVAMPKAPEKPKLDLSPHTEPVTLIGSETATVATTEENDNASEAEEIDSETSPPRSEPAPVTPINKAAPAAQAEKKSVQATALTSGEAWTIQIASFSDKGNVERLVSDLKKAGFAAYTDTIKSPHGEYIRVYVGPEVDKTKAQKTAQEIEKKTQIKGMVVRYKP